MKKEKFEFLEHTSDMKFKAYGKNPDVVFENAALAVSFYLSRGKTIKAKSKKLIEVEGEDTEALLYNFLDEILYLLDAENFAVSKAKVKIEDNKLKAAVYGDKASGYDLDHIKAATYAEMYIKKTKSGWEAQAVMDV